MAQDSQIEWTHHTWNPWMGCTKVSAGCANCYAETLMDTRYGKTKWGPRGLRVIKADAGWREPLSWDRKAAAAGERHRVFCASLADVFEGPDTMPEAARADVADARLRLFALIDRTPNLDWLLLTKRPENASAMIPKTPWDRCPKCGAFSDLTSETEREQLFRIDANEDGWACRKCNRRASFHRTNLWLGTSVESAAVKHRIDALRKLPAAVRFLSIEPLIGDVGTLDLRGIHWVIVGGDSGPNARPMHPQWARSIRDQCQAAGVAYFFKQWGEHMPWDHRHTTAEQAAALHSAGKIALHHRMMPDGTFPAGECTRAQMDDYMSRGVHMVRVGKKSAGRLLDGREWNEMPANAEATR